MAQYTVFDKETDVVENQRVIVSSGIFSAGAGSLTAFYTSSLQGNQSASFVNVYDKAEGDATREVQFAYCYLQVQINLHLLILHRLPTIYSL